MADLLMLNQLGGMGWVGLAAQENIEGNSSRVLKVPGLRIPTQQMDLGVSANWPSAQVIQQNALILLSSTASFSQRKNPTTLLGLGYVAFQTYPGKGRTGRNVATIGSDIIEMEENPFFPARHPSNTGPSSRRNVTTNFRVRKAWYVLDLVSKVLMCPILHI